MYTVRKLGEINSKLPYICNVEYAQKDYNFITNEISRIGDKNKQIKAAYYCASMINGQRKFNELPFDRRNYDTVEPIIKNGSMGRVQEEIESKNMRMQNIGREDFIEETILRSIAEPFRRLDDRLVQGEFEREETRKRDANLKERSEMAAKIKEEVIRSVGSIERSQARKEYIQRHKEMGDITPGETEYIQNPKYSFAQGKEGGGITPGGISYIQNPQYKGEQERSMGGITPGEISYVRNPQYSSSQSKEISGLTPGEVEYVQNPLYREVKKGGYQTPSGVFQVKY